MQLAQGLTIINGFLAMMRTRWCDRVVIDDDDAGRRRVRGVGYQEGHRAGRKVVVVCPQLLVGRFSSAREVMKQGLQNGIRHHHSLQLKNSAAHMRNDALTCTVNLTSLA